MAIKSGYTAEDLAKLGPDYLTKKRLLAEALMSDTTKQRKIEHPLQGLAQMAEALVGGLKLRKLDEAQKVGTSSADKLWSSIFSGSSSASTPPPSASSASASPIPMTGAAQEVAATSPNYRDAIASIESKGSGDYNAVGPTNPKMGRALGRYQIMEANIGPWSEAALGRAVTPDEFMGSPEIQDKIFDHRFGQYVNQFGPEGAAQAWFAGPGGVGKVDRKDVLGTDVGSYGKKFMRALGGGAQQVAQNERLGATVLGGQSGPTQEQLMSVISDPWVSDERKKIAQTLLGQEISRGNARYEQELKQQDPAYRLGLEKSQLEIDRMRNPQTPDSVQALDLRAQRAGLQPGTKEYNDFMLTGGSKGITVDARQMGNIPPGYQVQYDAEGRPASMTPIPGSPAALEMEAANRQKDMRTDNKATSGNVVVQDIDRAFNTMEGATLPTTGMAGELLSNIPGTAARDVRGLMDTIKANATFDKLQQMREASPTGGALGAVSDTENRLLAAAIGNLEQSQSEGQFKDNLGRVQNIYLDIIHGKGNGPERRKLSFEGKEPEAEVPLDDLLKKYGG